MQCMMQRRNNAERGVRRDVAQCLSRHAQDEQLLLGFRLNRNDQPLSQRVYGGGVGAGGGEGYPLFRRGSRRGGFMQDHLDALVFQPVEGLLDALGQLLVPGLLEQALQQVHLGFISARTQKINDSGRDGAFALHQACQQGQDLLFLVMHQLHDDAHLEGGLEGGKSGEQLRSFLRLQRLAFLQQLGELVGQLLRLVGALKEVAVDNGV